MSTEISTSRKVAWLQLSSTFNFRSVGYISRKALPNLQPSFKAQRSSVNRKVLWNRLPQSLFVIRFVICLTWWKGTGSKVTENGSSATCHRPLQKAIPLEVVAEQQDGILGNGETHSERRKLVRKTAVEGRGINIVDKSTGREC